MNAFDLLLNVEQEKVSAIRERNEILKENTEKEIRARDRVNISREEYEQMKKQIDVLATENEGYRDILIRMAIPVNKPIIPNSIYSCFEDDRCSFRRKYKVIFEVDML